MALVDTFNTAISTVQAWDESTSLHILLSLLVPLVAWLVRKPLAGLIFNLFKAIGKGVGFNLDDKFDESGIRAIQALIVVLGVLIAHERIQLPEPYFGIVEKLLVSICVMVVFTVVYSSCQFIPQFFEGRKNARAPEQLSWAVHVSQFLVAFIGIAAVLAVWGIDIGPVLTGMGVAGAAVALSAQDYLKNLLAGFNNAAERRFREGDWIRVEGLVEGIIESIDLRSTLVRRFDQAPVYVPNSELANNLLINFSRRSHRRIDWTISLTYATSIQTLRSIRERVEKYIDDSDHYVLPAHAARYVRVGAFTDSSIDIMILCFSTSNDREGYFVAKEELALAIKSIVEEEGASFAFPSRSIYTETSSSEDSDR